MRGTWKSDKYGLKQLKAGDVITVETGNRHLWSYLRNRGDMLGMTLKGRKLGGQTWQVTRTD